MQLWTTVESSFEIPGRGCWIIPSTALWDSAAKVRPTDKIQLRVPRGTVLDTFIDAIELGTRTTGTFLAVGLPKGITKKDVPEGTEIWLGREEKAQP